ncbi:MAG: methyltransferase domain-containing protein [Rhodospirillales bacterium]|nr:methyltransferase domain-containing protein [Rhodospirillales bacterium]
MTDGMLVFDRQAVRRHRERAAARLHEFDFLMREVADRVADRLSDIRRAFPLALDLGCHTGQVAAVIGARGGIATLVQSDLALNMVARAPMPGLVADEEALPFPDATFDLIISVLSLHWVNDLPGTLAQIRRALKPDGLFLAAMLGGETLKELRAALAAAELAVEGGISPRVSPFADVRDAGALLQRAGFALPVADTDMIVVSYAEPLRLMSDLRGMGESNAVIERRRTLFRRSTLMEAMTRYRDSCRDGDGRVPATFQIVYLTGWAPHEAQQKPLRPGSATARLADALDVREHPLSDSCGANPAAGS